MRSKAVTVGMVLVAIILLLWTLFPFYWTIITSLKHRAEITRTPPTFYPHRFTFKNFIEGMFGAFPPMLAYFMNSFIECFGGAVIALLIGIPLAYAGARYNFKGKKDIFFTVLTFRFLPPACVVIPIFMFARAFSLIDTQFLMACILAAINIPIVAWVMLSYFKEIPRELEESFMIDGYSEIQAFLKVTLPLSRPGLIAVTLLIVALSYGEFLFSSILTSSPAAKPLTVGISEYMGGEWGYYWGRIAAVTITGFIPLLIIYLIVRKHLVRGLTFGVIR